MTQGAIKLSHNICYKMNDFFFQIHYSAIGMKREKISNFYRPAQKFCDRIVTVLTTSQS